jgi:hypothetical protein
MILYEYEDGKIIRELTVKEEILYREQSNNGTCDGGAGTVDGNLFGYHGTVYAH